MGQGSPINLPSGVAQSANTGTDLLATLVSNLDLARNQFRARQVPEASSTADKLIAVLDALFSGESSFSQSDAALAKCIKACALTLRGRCAEEQGDSAAGRHLWEQAVALFAENRVHANPTPDMLGYYGAALRMTGDSRGAIAIFKQIVEAGAAVPETYRHYGLALKDQGLLPEAREQLKKALEIAPSDLRSLQGLAETCEALGGEAEKKEAAGAYLSLSEALTNIGDYGAALEAANNSLRLDDSEPKILCLRGDLLRVLGRYQEALASLDRYPASGPDAPVALASKGAALYSMGRYEEAMQVLDRAIELRASYHWAIRMKGNVLLAKGQIEEAGKAYQTAFNLAPSFWEAASELSRVHILLNQFEKAVEAADQALAIKSDDPFTLSMRGLALNQLGKYDDAIKSFDQAILVAPGYAPAWSRRALPLFNLQRNEEALATLEQALTLNSQDGWTWARKGEYLSRSPDRLKRQAAVPLLQKALALGAQAADAARLASTLESLGMLEEAVAAADKAIGMDPKSVEAYVAKADALRRLKRSDGGLQAIDEALELQPGLAYALGTKGQLLHDLGQNEQAEKQLRAALAADKGFPWIWEQLGEVLYNLGRPEEALAALEEALGLAPGDAAALRYKAYALTAAADNLRAKGDNTAALEQLEQAIKIAPAYATAHALQGLVLHSQTKNSMAEMALRKAVELEPDLVWARAELASACRDLEKPEEALAAVDEALRLKPDYASAMEIKARIMIDMGENELAVNLCEQALQIDETLWTSHFWKGLGFDNLGRVELALSEYQTAYAAGPDDVWIRRALADMLILAGTAAPALEHFEWIIERMSGQNRAPNELILCGWCHYGCGRLDPAIRLYSEAISQDAKSSIKSAPFDLALIIACSKRYARAQREYERAVELVLTAHPWLRKGILGVALSDLTRAMSIRYPHLAQSAEIKECLERLQSEYRSASDEPTRPKFTQAVKLQPA